MINLCSGTYSRLQIAMAYRFKTCRTCLSFQFLLHVTMISISEEFFRSSRIEGIFLGGVATKDNTWYLSTRGWQIHHKKLYQDSRDLEKSEILFFQCPNCIKRLGLRGTITSTRKRFSDTPLERFESMLSRARRMPSIYITLRRGELGWCQ